jgi:magnesium-transporting ATPase (P-type)
MTLAGIVMAQVGAGMAWRTDRLSVWSVGLLSNRLLLAGIAVEVAMIAVLAYVPGVDQVFSTAPIGPWHWLLLLLWPVLVLGVDEAHKARRRRRTPGA